MKEFKLLGSVALILCVFLTGCGKTKNIEGSLTDIMDKVYESVKDDMPELQNTKLNDDNIEYFLGTSDIDYKEGLASEPFINAIAHSVVLIRMNDGADIEATKTKIKNSVNPRKWICVEVNEDDVIVDSKGNLIILIMVNDDAKKIDESFQNLK